MKDAAVAKAADMASRGTPAMEGPTSLADMIHGMHSDGDCHTSSTLLPAWFDEDRYRKSHVFFTRHALSILISWHVSLTLGFSLPNLLTALVFTGDSNTPAKALARYELTAQLLIEWHLGNIMTPGNKDKAFMSLQGVRGIHASVRKDMSAASTGTDPTVWMSQVRRCSRRFMGWVRFGRHVCCPLAQAHWRWRLLRLLFRLLTAAIRAPPPPPTAKSTTWGQCRLGSWARSRSTRRHLG
jgi:hypothetical protein